MNCNIKNRFVTSEKHIVIGPKLLIIVLNRGKSDDYGSNKKNNFGYGSYGNYSSSKYDHTVEFEEDLSLDEKNNNNYDLRAVCNHLGSSSYGGHYTADVKQLGTNKWHHCDDSSVSTRNSNYNTYNYNNNNYHNKHNKSNVYSNLNSKQYSCQSAIMMIYAKK